ncbi:MULTISPECIES: hypothetical protein [Halorussus]|uniref:hypothetical protein n=1 Tax=Halorussus TaxID=1070314 RepID=UPI000E21085E|nr:MULTISPECIES: hypothetical protein [Halorussus]NHN57953.1 hypothetical protein [Halorussus sp. JP-T4]
MAAETVAGGPVGRTVASTGFALRAALGRRDGRAVFASVTVLYLVAYLWFSDLLNLGNDGVGLTVAGDPLGRFFELANGALSFEPVALVEFGLGTYLFSLNTVLGLGVAVLVGLNLAVTYLAWRQPAACGIGTSSTGVLAGVPALLSGAACCGSVVLIVFGIQASSTLLTAFEWLIPSAVVLLVGSLLWIGRQVEPALA